MECKPIAYIHNDFATKFGLPRQSGLVPEAESLIVFEPEYREVNAFRGLEDYSHLWLIWHFSAAEREGWSPTVRPPRLGGNIRMGVFATRSPFRPNALGLSSVELKQVHFDETQGPVLVIAGADLMDGTPIFDIKPYLAFTDSHPEAKGGFAAEIGEYHLRVDFPERLLTQIPEEKRQALLGILREDPRPAYHHDEDRVYGLPFADFDVRFCVRGQVLTVTELIKIRN